jgi:hypothetical protein
MAMTKFTIVRGDETETVVVKPRHVLRIEREFNEQEPVEITYRMAWMASGTDMEFDAWMDTVDEITAILPEDLEDKDEEVPPTTKGSRTSRS